jgi:hypothetical protein
MWNGWRPWRFKIHCRSSTARASSIVSYISSRRSADSSGELLSGRAATPFVLRVPEAAEERWIVIDPSASC